ncbi:MAG: hypothetical protein OXM62_00110 [bacterium]|nr:hypothetical protein [bacterium]MDE0233395.1 hypothetical protein [bacterium]
MERRRSCLVLVWITLLAFLTVSCGSGIGEPAEDFNLNLQTGGTFVLSEQTTPVLLFFWAEW